MEGYGLSSLGPTVGLSGLPDPMGDATAQLEARRRQQVTDAGYPGAAADATNPFGGILSALGPTINERAVAAREAMRRGDMATANALNQSLALDFGQFLGSIKPIRAYHGSPHDFDRFSMDKIGTGEGNQAYGRGLYFAESEGVARSYRDTLTDQWKQWYAGNNPRPAEGSIAQRLGNLFDNEGTQFSKGSRRIDEVASRLGGVHSAADGMEQYTFRDGSRLLIAETGWDVAGPHNPGRMYEVDIHADPSRFLDWDKPLSAQSDKARAALADMKPEWTGGQIYESSRLVPGDFMDKRAAASALRERGIPGIKYLDAGSRAAGDGSRNYVVFDDKIVEILRKYGIMAPVAGAGLSALYLGDEEGGM